MRSAWQKTWTLAVPAALLAGCGGPGQAPDVIVVDTPGAVSIRGEVLGGQLVRLLPGRASDRRGLDADHDGAVVQRRGIRLQRGLPPAAERRRQGLQAGRYGSGVHRPQQPADGRWRTHRAVHGRRHGSDGRGHEHRLAMPPDPRRAARPRLRGRVRAGARRRPVPVRGYAGAGRLAPARIRRCRMAVRGRAQRSRRQTARRL